jgi:HAD superfamily phosphoserine phosphatase-like hydrolase
MSMKASESTPPRRWVAVFDLDGTLTWRDTLLLFSAAYLRRHPRRLFGLWRLPFAVLSFVARDRDRGKLKSRIIRMVMGGASRASVDECAGSFVSTLASRRRLRPAALAVLEAHRAAGDHLVLLSASPDLYVPGIGRSLGFERSLCTGIEWRADRLDGALTTENRRGEEKSRCLDWLRTQYPDLPIVAYGNSRSDLDHMRHADRALLVNGNAAARRLAAQSGIPTSNWT